MPGTGVLSVTALIATVMLERVEDSGRVLT
jgi:hypothetical protein